MILDFIYPAQYYKIVRDLKMANDLNISAVKQLNKWPLIILSFGVLIGTMLALKGQEFSAISAIFLGAFIYCYSRSTIINRYVIPYSIGEKKAATITAIRNESTYYSMPSSWFISYSFQDENGKKREATMNLKTNKFMKDGHKVGDEIIIFVDSKDFSKNGILVPNEFSQLCLSKRRIQLYLT